jgi:hypothetical protein
VATNKAQDTVEKTKLPTLTVAQTAAVFGVSTMTVFNWRKGTATRDPLKVCTDPEKTWFPRFRVTELQRYAKKHKLEFARQPEDVLATWEHKTPGRQPKVVIAVKARDNVKKSSKAVKKKTKH